MSLYSEREKITELQEVTDLDLEDLIEIVDRFGGPSSGPVSRKVEISTLLSFFESENYLQTLLIDGVYDDSEASFDLDDSNLTINLHF